MPPRRADHLHLVPSGKPAPARRAAEAAPRRARGDWMWHGLGGAVAAASAGFATYAMVFSTGEVVPSGNFSVFNRYDRLYQAASARHAAPAAPPVETAGRDGVDFAPTGSLAGRAAPAQGGAEGAGAGGRADGPALPSFRLRDVFDGKALVESRASLSVVKPGSVLDGAGEVLSIEKRGERWVVVTRNGVIAGQAR